MIESRNVNIIIRIIYDQIFLMPLLYVYNELYQKHALVPLLCMQAYTYYNKNHYIIYV